MSGRSHHITLILDKTDHEFYVFTSGRKCLRHTCRSRLGKQHYNTFRPGFFLSISNTAFADINCCVNRDAKFGRMECGPSGTNPASAYLNVPLNSSLVFPCFGRLNAPRREMCDFVLGRRFGLHLDTLHLTRSLFFVCVLFRRHNRNHKIQIAD